MTWQDLGPAPGLVDGVVLVLLALAAFRGTLRGLIGEAFSIGALAAACLAVRLFGPAASGWVAAVTRDALGVLTPWAAGAGLAIAAIAAVAVAGRLLRRGARAAGLGWADRLGGGALGLAEGALVAAALLLAAGWWLGDGHPLLADSRSVAALEELREAAGDQVPGLPAVGAGPRWADSEP